MRYFHPENLSDNYRNDPDYITPTDAHSAASIGSNLNQELIDTLTTQLTPLWSVGVPANFRADMDRFIDGFGAGKSATRFPNGPTGTETRIKFNR